MASSRVPHDTLYTEVVQVFRGGEPDDDGISLAGHISPLAATCNTRTCACFSAPLPYELWEFLDGLNPYARDSDIWLRVLNDQEEAPIPEGATLIATRRVSYQIS